MRLAGRSEVHKDKESVNITAVLVEFYSSRETREAVATSSSYSVVDIVFFSHRNNTYQRASFHLRRQGQGETVEPFVTAFHRLVSYCGYGALNTCGTAL